MLVAVFTIVIFGGAVLAGRGYVDMAERMRSFATTQATVLARDVRKVDSDGEAMFGDGGDHEPCITYAFEVDGVAYTSDNWGYAQRPSSLARARERAAAIPDVVTVHYDPADPQTVFLHTHTPRIGRWFVAVGWAGVVVGIALGVGAVV